MQKIIALLLCTLSAHAVTQLSTQAIGFEIRNHDTYPIEISLYDPVIDVNRTEPIYYIKNEKIPGQQGKNISSLQYPLDISGFTKLEVTYQDPSTGIKTTKSYTFAPRKTIFVAWENKQIRPQKGAWGGKTQSGLNLKNNITIKDILSKNESRDYSTGYYGEI